MGKISLTDVQPGMVLCTDVVGTGERLLLKAGTQLTQDHVRVCLMWGVVDVDVEGVSQADVNGTTSAQLAPSELAAVEARVGALFRHNERGQPVIDELVRLATVRLIRRAAGGFNGR